MRCPWPKGNLTPLERILAAGRHLMTLITNVLDFSKNEQGKIELSLSPVAVSTLLHEAADVVAPLVQQQANELRIIYAPDVGLMTTDAGKVRQILINLLANAAKFTDQGVITLHAWRDDRATLGVPAAMISFEVSDTGIGIAPEYLTRLFQPFSQVDASVTRRYEGTGLGLAIAKHLVEGHGGRLWVTSTEGRGEQFQLYAAACLRCWGHYCFAANALTAASRTTCAAAASP